MSGNLLGTWENGGQERKPETANPKSQTNSKLEYPNPDTVLRSRVQDFDFRASDFPRISDFVLRISKIVLFESSLEGIAMNTEQTRRFAHVAGSFLEGQGDELFFQKLSQVLIASIRSQKLLKYCG
jgi:hypothetical protein